MTLMGFDEFLRANPDWEKLMEEVQQQSESRQQTPPGKYNSGAVSTSEVGKGPNTQVEGHSHQPIVRSYNVPEGYLSPESMLISNMPNLPPEALGLRIEEISRKILKSNYRKALESRNLGTDEHPYAIFPESYRDKFSRICNNDGQLRRLLSNLI